VEEKREQVFELDVGGYHCRVRALSLGNYLFLNEGALPFITVEKKEQILLKSIIEPQELIDAIVGGSIPYGVPLLVFDFIIEHSGFALSQEERNEFLTQARQYIATSVIDSCRAMILASGISTIEDMETLTMTELLALVALSENVLSIRQQNFIAAMSGGQPLELIWESNTPESELEKRLRDKQPEVDALLEQQASSRYGRGGRRV
jgi:hypothetical protein